MTTLTTPKQPNRSPIRRAGRNGVGAKPVVTPIPRLENGDHLTRDEFERRYNAMPSDVKAELIEGVVYIMASPVNTRNHGNPHYQAIYWLGNYSSETPGIVGADNSTVRLDDDNEPQPDVFLVIDPAAGGTARFDDKGYLESAPELIVEVASSTVSYDLYEKLTAYQRNGVKEYIIWRVQDDQIDWRVLRDGEYELLEPDDNGLLRSEVFPGLTLDAVALVKGDMKRVARAQRAALRSPEYKQFAAKLAAALKKKS